MRPLSAREAFHADFSRQLRDRRGPVPLAEHYLVRGAVHHLPCSHFCELPFKAASRSVCSSSRGPKRCMPSRERKVGPAFGPAPSSAQHRRAKGAPGATRGSRAGEGARPTSCVRYPCCACLRERTDLQSLVQRRRDTFQTEPKKTAALRFLFACSGNSEQDGASQSSSSRENRRTAGLL